MLSHRSIDEYNALDAVAIEAKREFDAQRAALQNLFEKSQQAFLEFEERLKTVEKVGGNHHILRSRSGTLAAGAGGDQEGESGDPGEHVDLGGRAGNRPFAGHVQDCKHAEELVPADNHVELCRQQ